MVRERLDGVFPPVPTPFDAGNGRVDRRALAENVRRWMQTGLAGVLALGSNGEAALLDESECDEVVATVRESVPADRSAPGRNGPRVDRATIDARDGPPITAPTPCSCARRSSSRIR